MLAMCSTSAFPWRRAYKLLAAAAILFAAVSLFAQPLPKPVMFHVSLSQASMTAVSSRLLVFAKLLGPGDTRPVTRVDMDQIDTHATAIAAQEVPRLAYGSTVDVEAANVSAGPVMPACAHSAFRRHSLEVGYFKKNRTGGIRVFTFDSSPDRAAIESVYL